MTTVKWNAVFGLTNVAVWVTLIALLCVPAYGQNTKLVASFNMPHLTPEIQDELVADFEAKHGVEVELATRNPAQLIAMFAAGQQIDVVQVNSGFHLMNFAGQGLLRDIDEYIERTPGFTDDWLPQIVDQTKYQGKTYLVPRGQIDPLSLLWVNVGMVQDAGLGVPRVDWTRDEFEEYARRLRADRNGDGVVDQWAASYESWQGWKPWWLNGGGRYTDPDDPARLALGDPSSRDSLEWIQQSIRTGLMPRPDQLRSNIALEHTSTDYPGLPAFLEGVVAMATEGARKAVEDMNTVGMDGAVTLVPAGPGGQISVVGWQGHGISSTSAHADLAWEWIKHINQEKYWRYWISASFTPTISRSLTNEFITVETGVDQFREAFVAFFQKPFVSMQPYVPQEIFNGLRQIVDPVLALEKEPAVAIAEVIGPLESAWERHRGEMH